MTVFQDMLYYFASLQPWSLPSTFRHFHQLFVTSINFSSLSSFPSHFRHTLNPWPTTTFRQKCDDVTIIFAIPFFHVPSYEAWFFQNNVVYYLHKCHVYNKLSNRKEILPHLGYFVCVLCKNFRGYGKSCSGQAKVQSTHFSVRFAAWRLYSKPNYYHLSLSHLDLLNTIG